MVKKGDTASTKLMCCGESTGTPIRDCHSAGEASAAQPPLSACPAEPANAWLALLTHTHSADLGGCWASTMRVAWPDGSGQARTAEGLHAAGEHATEQQHTSIWQVAVIQCPEADLHAREAGQGQRQGCDLFQLLRAFRVTAHNACTLQANCCRRAMRRAAAARLDVVISCLTEDGLHRLQNVACIACSCSSTVVNNVDGTHRLAVGSAIVQA